VMGAASELGSTTAKSRVFSVAPYKEPKPRKVS
jgi:hypothetical protein